MVPEQGGVSVRRWAYQGLWLVTGKLLFPPGGSGAHGMVRIKNWIPVELLPFQDKSVETQRYFWELVGGGVRWGIVEWSENYKLSEKFSA